MTESHPAPHADGQTDERSIANVVAAFSKYGNAIGSKDNPRITEAVMDFYAAIADLRAALASRSPIQGEPRIFIFPNDAWNDYAALSGLVGEDGIAPQPATTQAAHSAYQAAWNSCHAAFSAYIARRPVAQPVTSLQAPNQGEIEKVARAMALHEGWGKWDTAVDCTDTSNGCDPDDERDYWLDLAEAAIKAMAMDAATKEKP